MRINSTYRKLANRRSLYSGRTSIHGEVVIFKLQAHHVIFWVFRVSMSEEEQASETSAARTDRALVLRSVLG